LADAFCIALYAGAEAERLIVGSEDGGDSVDCERATACLEMVGVRGAAFVKDDVWDRHVELLRRKAKSLVSLHRTRIERVGQALIERGRLSEDEIECLMSNGMVGTRMKTQAGEG
jgi:hypothetical protein